MLRIRIELIPGGVGKAKEIGRLEIRNVSWTGRDAPRGDYEGKLYRKGSTTKVVRTGSVKNHPRLSAPVWVLVYKMLKQLLEKQQ